MTQRQMIYLNADLWPAACRFQGWAANDRCKRLEVLAQLVGRPLESSKEIDSGKDFDAVRKGLQELAAKLPLDDGGLAARKRVKIREHLRCLALYHPDAEGYFRQMVLDLCGGGPAENSFAIRETPLQHLIEDLSSQPVIRRKRNGDTYEASSDLERVLMTLNGRLNGATGFRAKARDSLHDMLKKAGLPCACKQCSGRDALPRVHAQDAQERVPTLVEVPF